MTTRIHVRTIVLSLLTACLLLGLAAGAARADFELPAFDVTTDGSSSTPRATIDSGGAAHFVWQQGDGLQTRMRSADGALGPVKAVTPAGSTDQQLAADHAGNVQLVWRTTGAADWIARTRRIQADGTLGPVVDLSSAGFKAWNPQLAFDATGGIVFVWTRTLDTGLIVQGRRMAPDGTLGPVQNISPAGDVQGNRIAVDDEGNAVIAWSRNDGSFLVAQARRWAADGTFGPVVNLTSTGANSAEVSVGMDGAGIAHFVFLRAGVLLTRRMGVGGVLGPEKDLRAYATDNAQEPSLAVDKAGNAQFVWRVISPTTGYAVETRREFPDGSFGPMQQLGEYPSGLIPDARVALDASGTAHHIWLNRIGSKNVVMARSVRSDGSLGAIQQLSASSSGWGGNAANPALAIGANGRPIASWTRTTDAYDELVQGAVLHPEPVAGDAGGAAGGTSPAPASGGTGGSGSTAGADRLAPKLSGLVMKPARLLVQKRGRVVYTLSERSSVVFRIVRRGATRRVVGRLRASGVAGKNRLAFPRRFRGRYLRPGRYRLVAVATDRAGNRSLPARARFRVTRG